MRKSKLFLFAVLISLQGMAQQFVFNEPTLVANTYPLNSTTNNLRQAIFYPSNFSNPSSGTITAIYILNDGTSTANFSNLSVKLGETTLDTFPNTSVVTGLQTVYSGAYNQPNIAGGYIKIPLQTPYVYDSTKNLMLELSQTGYTTGVSIEQVNNGALTSRTLFATVGNATGTRQDRLPVFGFDLATGLGTQEQHFYRNLEIYPNPTTNIINFTKNYHGSVYRIYNSVGQIVTEGKMDGHKVDVSRLKTGSYTISVTDDNEGVLNSKFIKQ